MKKIIITILFALTSSVLLGENYKIKKLHEFENKNEAGYLYIIPNEKLDPYEGVTGNMIKIDSKGKFYIYQEDNRIIYNIDNRNYKVVNKITYKLLPTTSFMFVEDGMLGFQIYGDGFFIIDEKTNNKIVDIDNLNTFIKSTYYSKSENIFLFTDKSSNIHSIIHPCLDEEENKKNYRTPEETRELFSENSEYGKKGIVIDGKKLFINGKIYYWKNILVNKSRYIIGEDNIYIKDNVQNKVILTIPVAFNSEQFESAAVHPSGDIYILRMNRQTNTHNLYCIENTWDPEWREQWYKEHPEAARP